MKYTNDENLVNATKNEWVISNKSDISNITTEMIIERIRNAISSIKQPTDSNAVAIWADYVKDINRLIDAIEKNDNLSAMEIDAAYDGLKAVYSIRINKKCDELRQKSEELEEKSDKEDYSKEELSTIIGELKEAFNGCFGILALTIISSELGPSQIFTWKEKRRFVTDMNADDVFTTATVEGVSISKYEVKCVERILGEYEEFNSFWRKIS